MQSTRTRSATETQRHRGCSRKARQDREVLRTAVRRRREATRATGVGRIHEPPASNAAHESVRSSRASWPALQASRRTIHLCVSASLWLIFSVFSVPSVSIAAQSPPTFTKDVAAIVWTRCASCHRPGGIGPFSLLTYNDVKRRVTQIAAVTNRRLMPPWKPEAGKGEFQDERRLTDRELETIQRWIAGSAIEGDPGDLPPMPSWGDGWR